MRAVVIRKFGGPDVLEVVQDWPRPVRQRGEVLVEVVASSVNPVDWKTRRGDAPRLISTLPKVLGGDVAGTVLESDPGSRFQPGAEVYSCTEGFQLWKPWGTYAEQVSVPEAHLALKPAKASFEEAAGLPLAALTAWQALDAARIEPGQRLLVHAGAGGVGSLGVQVAKARGAHVTTTCSTRNLAFLRELGADEAVDYTSQRFEEVCSPFDAVIDLVGGDYETRSLRALKKKGGVFVSVLNSGWQAKYGNTLAGPALLYHTLKGKLLEVLGLGPRYCLILVKPNGRQLEQIAALVDEGKLKPIVDRVFTLEEVRDAHTYHEASHARGKVILKVKVEPIMRRS